MSFLKPKQIGIYKGQVSNAGVCPLHALPRRWQLDSQGFEQGLEKTPGENEMIVSCNAMLWMYNSW